MEHGVQAFTQSFKAICNEHWRWESLTIGEVYWWDESLSAWRITPDVMMGDITIASFPALREVTLRTTHHLALDIKCLEHAPKMPHVRTLSSQAKIDWSVFPSPSALRSVSLDTRALEDEAALAFLDALCNAPLLEDLEIVTTGRCEGWPSGGQRAPVELPSLSRLSLHGSKTFAPFVLEHIRTHAPLKQLIILAPRTRPGDQLELLAALDSPVVRSTLSAQPFVKLKVVPMRIQLTAGTAVDIHLRPWPPRLDYDFPGDFFECAVKSLDFPGAPPVHLELKRKTVSGLEFLRHYPSLEVLSYRTSDTWALLKYLAAPQPDPMGHSATWVAARLRSIVMHSDIACISKKISSGLTNVVQARMSAAASGEDVEGDISVFDRFSGWELDVEKGEFVKQRDEFDLFLDIAV